MDYEVEVSKTAETSFTRTYDWDITKTPNGDYVGFAGDSFAHKYTITVDRTGYTDSDWAVEGDIVIENSTPFDATIESVADSISGYGAPDSLWCDGDPVFPFTLVSGATLTCHYSSDLPNGDDRVNTATVTTSGMVGGGEAEADVDFSTATITEVNAMVNVTDDYGTPGDPADDAMWGPLADDDSVTYTRTFACSTDSDDYTDGTYSDPPLVNTATIDETGDDDTATVNLTCYELAVTKDATTSFNRYWDWTIDKSADQTHLTLSQGQLFQVNYEVTVDATYTDADYAVAGNISISNPAPMDAELTAVTDVVSPDIAASVNCPSLTVPAGGSLDCTYSTDLPDSADRTNTATATLQNYAYDADGTPTADGTTDFSGSADVTFSDTPDDEIDECVDVNDTNVGFLGTVCADEAPATFYYSLWFGNHPDADVYLECGYNEHPNVADFETNDTGTTGDDDWTVTADVTCEYGCTLTQGYWKTHNDSFWGGAPTDDTWYLILPDAEQSEFDSSGMSWFEVFWTSPKGGNVWYQLAHQWMAAKLNILNGADPSAVSGIMDDAYDWLVNHDPAAKIKGKDAKDAHGWATMLDGYNNGDIGPGHCDEDSTSDLN